MAKRSGIEVKRGATPMRKRGEGQGSRGQATVEMALVLPLFLLFLGGILIFGFAFYDYLMIGNVASQVVREASLGQLGQPPVTSQGQVERDMVTLAESQIQGKLFDGKSAVINAYYGQTWGQLPSALTGGTSSGTPQPSGVFTAMQISLPINAIFQLPFLPSGFTLSTQAILPIETPGSSGGGASPGPATNNTDNNTECEHSVLCISVKVED